MTNRQRRRAGISLIELLVSHAIIGMLAALLLPAVQNARETARRAACANHLRQIGVALQSYASDHGGFPPLFLDGRPGGHWNWITLLLPQLGETTLYNSFNFYRRAGEVVNTTAGRTSLEILLCPSDSRPPFQESGFMNYPACNGSGVWPKGVDAIVVKQDFPQGDGLFPNARVFVRPGDCTDGLSHTAAVCEHVHGGRWVGVRPADIKHPVLGFIYGFDQSPRSQTQLIEDCARVAQSEEIDGLLAGTPWHTPVAVPYTHLQTPGGLSCCGISFPFSPITASSWHNQGVNLLFADGHVHFIPRTIDLTVWRALGSRSGGEQVDDNF